MDELALVSGLVAKRGELSGEAEHHRREFERLVQEVTHLDATIALFDPSYQVERVGRRRCLRRQQRFGSGECQRLVLEVLRDAAGPMSDRAIARRLVAHKGWDPSRGLGPVQKTVLAVLRRLAAKGVAPSVVLGGGARAWERS